LKYLFSEQKKIEKKIRRAKSILLVCDFDGTLASIKPTPRGVRLPQETKRLLFLLAKDKNNNVGIISGRSLSEIKKIVGVDNIFYAGNHGFEIKLPKRKKFVHPQAKKFRYLLKKLTKELKERLRGYKGLLVENKISTLSIHYRRCPAAQITRIKKDIRSIFLPLVKEKKIKITGGKKVIEIRPPVNWDKGKALSWIKDKLKARKALTIYLGDDETDEDAFACIEKGLAIYVGTKKRHSRAKFYLPEPKKVINFLKFLIKTKKDDRIKKSK
jgi:trehalose-phosphatase